MKFSIILLFSFLTCHFANAVSTPCSLLQTPLPPGLITDSDSQIYFEKLKSECALSSAYQSLKLELRTKYNLSLEQITEYQAMRYVRRVDFENSRTKEIPIEKTYQILRSQYQLPNEQKSSIIWDNWIAGLRQLAPAIADLQAGKPFTIETLKRIHIGFFTLSEETGDDANAPDVGIFKPAVPNDNYWWDFANDAEAANAKATVDKINAHYQAMGLLPNFKEDRLNRVLDVRLAVKRQAPEKQNTIEYVNVLYAAQTQAVPTHLNNIMVFMNTLLKAALENKPLIWKNSVLTPGEAAYLIQKFYIGVHPFSDGNGRTSRFIQELMLGLFEMPQGSSGDLMDYDVLSTFPDYYYRAITANISLIKKVKACLDQYAKSDSSALDYSCRILQPKH